MSRDVLAVPWDRMVGFVREHSKAIWEHRRELLIYWMKRSAFAMIFFSFLGLVPGYADVWVMFLIVVVVGAFSLFLEKDRGWTIIGIVAGVFVSVAFAAPILQPIKYYAGTVLVALGKAGMNGSGGLRVGWLFAFAAAFGGLAGVSIQRIGIYWWFRRRYQEGKKLLSDGQTLTAVEKDLIADFWYSLEPDFVGDMARVIAFGRQQRADIYLGEFRKFQEKAGNRIRSEKYQQRHKT